MRQLFYTELIRWFFRHGVPNLSGLIYTAWVLWSARTAPVPAKALRRARSKVTRRPGRRCEG